MRVVLIELEKLQNLVFTVKNCQVNFDSSSILFSTLSLYFTCLRICALYLNTSLIKSDYRFFKDGLFFTIGSWGFSFTRCQEHLPRVWESPNPRSYPLNVSNSNWILSYFFGKDSRRSESSRNPSALFLSNVFDINGSNFSLFSVR